MFIPNYVKLIAIIFRFLFKYVKREKMTNLNLSLINNKLNPSRSER